MPPSIPVATYRLQLTADFTFDQAAALVPYLRAIGISHLYSSPFLKARAGSTHGYDVVEHNSLNPELGGEEAFERLCDSLKTADMGLILDFVPNHMGVHYADNPWWLDVLEWGPKSPYAASFDIDWQTLPGRPRGGILIPILGRAYGEALECGEIALRYEPSEGSFSAWYFEHRLPIGPNRYGEIVQKIVAQAAARDEPAGRKLLQLATRYRGPYNPPRSEAPAFKAELAAIAGAREVIDRGIRAYQPTSGEPGALLALHHLLERQHYRLAYWRLAGSDINYRRFFDINTLAGLRVEDAGTFAAIHALVRRLISKGCLHGLRLDHIDGLRDPHQYFRRLQRLIDVEAPPGHRRFYMIAEKILADGERLPRFSGVAGTTGYEWLNIISRVLVDDRGLPILDRTWRVSSGDERSFEEIVIESKRRVIATILSSEFTVLTRLLARIAAGHYSTRDYTAERLRTALELFVLHFPIYRTYLTPSGPSREDRAIIETALAKARADWFGSDIGVFDFLRDALTLDLVAPGRTGHSIARNRHFAFKVQQFTGPMMAKSLEDTAFYRYARLLALNEVGGDAAAGGLSIAGFHERMQQRAAKLPHGLTATATHDTKRGEDARMRLIALSELADDWARGVHEWRALNAKFAGSAGQQPRSPSPAHEYMLYQALLGAWPLGGLDADFIERMQAYAIKAAREGKEQTSWLAPDEAYETGLRDFLGRALDRRQSARFIDSFDVLARRAALLGALRSLTQLALKTTMPGVPDFYQGTEFWDLSLVDPDNRRRVDFQARSSLLKTGDDEPDWPALIRTWPSGQVKFALMRRLLALRRRLPNVFTNGSYRPLEVAGRDGNEILAFARISGRNAVIVVGARLSARASGGGLRWPPGDAWDASLAAAGFSEITNALTDVRLASGPELAIADLFDPLPVVVLEAQYAPVRRERAAGNPDTLAHV
jgi:(1->4)-alpha-D-glucan 1-alpha-D-glucosylmutase